VGPSDETGQGGAVIAQGRDTEIVDLGDGLVLRRPMVPRSMAREAAVMRWAHDRGYPCPTAHEVVDDGLIMDRIVGVSMLDELVRRPNHLRRHATLLADLHGWLHRLPAPPELEQPFGPGTSLLHGDLHPGNVLLTADGPLVIDWTNASAGPAGADVAVTWLLLAAADAPSSRLEQLLVAQLRGIFVRSFLRAAGRDAAAPYLAAAVAHRRRDPHLSPAELDAMDRLVSRHGRDSSG
jgi:aminoglycoside phosphotransferase (APT) family kinase protein